MAEWTFQEFLARQKFKAKFILPVCRNIRGAILDRIGAALEWTMYDDEGATIISDQGATVRPVLPKFAADYLSEVGIVSVQSPILAVIPAEAILVTEGDERTGGTIAQESEIDIRIDLVQNFNPGEILETMLDQLTIDLLIYTIAVVHCIFTFYPSDLTAGITPTPGGVQWDVRAMNFGSLRQRGSSYKRSASIRMVVRSVES